MQEIRIWYSFFALLSFGHNMWRFPVWVPNDGAWRLDTAIHRAFVPGGERRSSVGLLILVPAIAAGRLGRLFAMGRPCGAFSGGTAGHIDGLHGCSTLDQRPNASAVSCARNSAAAFVLCSLQLGI